MRPGSWGKCWWNSAARPRRSGSAHERGRRPRGLVTQTGGSRGGHGNFRGSFRKGHGEA
jgi:hypothetical protein